MGDVWRVWDLRERTYRAAKLQRQSDSAALLRFVRESSTRVDHPHVTTPTGWWADDGRVLFVMPIVGGGSVAVLLADHGALGEWWAKTLGIQLLDALAAVHAAGIVHRDVKPSNLLLEVTGTGAPTLRLSDFGIAISPEEPRLTHTAEVVHTPGYAAPETLHGADPDPRQDLYAAGVVLVELLTGARPGDTIEVPPGPLSEVISRLVATDPAQRYATATEARAALAAVPVSPPDGEPVEVFDHVPPLPPGWGPDGPASSAPADTTVATPVTAANAIPADTPVALPADATRPMPTDDAGSAGGPPGHPPRRSVPWPAVALAVLGVALLVAAVVTALA